MTRRVGKNDERGLTLKLFLVIRPQTGYMYEIIPGPTTYTWLGQ
jgi:hypothetical protein